MNELHLDRHQADELWSAYYSSEKDTVSPQVGAKSLVTILSFIPGLTNPVQYRETIQKTFARMQTDDEPILKWNTAYLTQKDSSDLFVKVRKIIGNYTYSGCLDVTIKRQMPSKDAMQVGFIISERGTIMGFDLTHYDVEGYNIGCVRWLGDKVISKGDIGDVFETTELKAPDVALLPSLTANLLDTSKPFNFENILR